MKTISILFFLGCAALAFWLGYEAFDKAHLLTKENDEWASDAFWLGGLWFLVGLRNLSNALKTAASDCE